jgi:hypothetical protein
VADISLDLSRRAWSRVLGNLTLIGTWLRGGAIGDAWRPCLVIVRTGEEFNAVPCVVPMDMAHVWDCRTGKGDPATAARTAMMFTKALRLDDGQAMKQAMRIATVIADHLDDLLSMPPAPPDNDAPVVAEAIITVNETGERFEATMRG